MVTTIDQLKNVKVEFEMDLPPFLDGKPFRARLRYLDPADVYEALNKIPNPLGAAVNELTDTGSSANDETSEAENWAKEHPAESAKIFEPIAAKALVSPTYEEICECVGKLTAAQICAIYKATAIDPVKQYEKFC